MVCGKVVLKKKRDKKRGENTRICVQYSIGAVVWYMYVRRSVSLVGEGERKLLKELVKKAKIPAKSRVIPQEVVTRYRDRIQELAEEIKATLKKEREEKEVHICMYV